MKTIVIAMSATCIMGVAAAQTITAGGTHGSGPGIVSRQPANSSVTDAVDSRTVAERLAAELMLTAEQQTHVEAILDEQRARMDDLIRTQKASGQDLGADQMRAMEQLREDSMDKVRALLTPIQLQNFEELARSQGTQLLSGLTVRVHAPDALCDNSGKCIRR